MTFGTNWLRLTVVLISVLVVMKFVQKLGLEILTPVVLAVALVASIAWQIRSDKHQRTPKPPIGSNYPPAKSTGIITTPIALAMAAIAMLIGIAAMLNVMETASAAERQIVLSLMVPGWTCLVAKYIYGSKLAELDPSSKRTALIYLWLAQVLSTLAAPGLIDVALGVSRSLQPNLEPLTLLVLAGLAAFYYDLSRA